MVTEPRSDAPTRLVTADELLQLSKDEFYGELIRGELCEEMPPGFRHEKIVAKLIVLLSLFVEARGLGTVTGCSGVWTERDPDTVRAPDVQFYSAERLSLDDQSTGYIEIAPDLVVEVRSPNHSLAKLRDKASMWLDVGVRLVWVVNPEQRSVDVYRPAGEVLTLTGGDEPNGLDVLPGFNCSLDAIFGPADQAASPATR